MPTPLSVLVVEDSPEDAELIVRGLRQAGYEPEWERVDTEPAYLERLKGRLDLVLSDYDMPQFNAVRALELLLEHRPEVPIIIVSGTIGEETAVEVMKMGASDYLLKDRLARLGAAVTHATMAARHKQEHWKSMTALRESEERFRQLAESIHEVFWMRDESGNRMLYVSPAYERIWGRTCESLYAAPQTWIDAIHPDDRGRVLGAGGMSQPAGTYDEEYRILRPDGTERWIRDRAFYVRGAEGSSLRTVGVAEDITDRKKLQEQFLRAQRMEAIGTLAGGIAHDLNNILAPVLMLPALLKESSSSEHEKQLLDMIEQGAQRGANLVRQLLTFSRGTGGERVSVQMRHLLKEMIEIMRETFPRDIAVENHSARDLWPVKGDPTQLHQVLINLCVNARDAMPDGGKLVLEARNAVLSEDEVRSHPSAGAGMHVAVGVTDTGHGMSPEIADRIFDPFFTTKPLTKGTGLGLSTALGIVRSHKGFITVESKPGRGTTFTMYLPVAQEDAAAPPPEGSDSVPPRHGELVLVVDDEVPVRSATRMMLARHGYSVLTAGDGEEALASYFKNKDAVRVVMCDVMMPVMGGLPLVRALRAAAPQLILIAMSGLNDQAVHDSLKAAGVNAVLSKPFTRNELLKCIHAQLSAG
jgi:PAS domain S-box-containing protein